MHMGDQDQRPVHRSTSRAWLAAVGLAALSSGSVLAGAGAASAEEAPTAPVCWTEVDENGDTWEFCEDTPDGGTDDGTGEGGGEDPCDGEECLPWPGDGSGVPPGEEECVDLPVYEEPPSEEPPAGEEPTSEETGSVVEEEPATADETDAPSDGGTDLPSDEPTTDDPWVDPWDPDVETCWSGYCMYVVETGQPILCASPQMNDQEGSGTDDADGTTGNGAGGTGGGTAGGTDDGTDEDPNASVPTRVDAGLADVSPRTGADRDRPGLLAGSVAAASLALVGLLARRRRAASA